jgi:hypothetical protein
MTNIKNIALIFLLALGLGACGAQPATFEDGGPKVNHELIFQPQTSKEQGLGSCYVIEWVAVLTDIRTHYFDSEDLANALGGITAARTVFEGIDYTEEFYPATEWRRASIAMLRHLDLDDRIRDRILKGLAYGLSPGDLFDLGKRLAANAAMTEAFIDDVKDQVAGLRAGTYTVDQLLNECRSYLKKVEDRMVGRL